MKLPNIAKLAIGVGVASLLFLGLSIGSAFYTVNRSKASIDAIGAIVVDNDLTLTSAKSRIDTAVTNYGKLDKNLKLNERIDNIDVLYSKEKEFVNVSILLANSIDQQKVKLNYTNEQVAKYILNIDDYKKEYSITDDEFKALTSYSTYTLLKDKYKDYLNSSSNENSSSNNSSKDEEIELC